MSAVVIVLTSTLVVLPHFLPHVSAYTEISTPIGTIVWGVLDFDLTWTSSKNPYIVEGFVTVANGATLSIEAGVTIRVNESSSRGHLYVEGNLVVEGTENAPVVVTSNRTIPAPDDYGNIWINASAHLDMSWAEVWYAHVPLMLASGGNIIRNSKFVKDSLPLEIFGPGNILDRVEVTHIVSSPAFWVRGANTVVTNSTIQDNIRGLMLDTGSSGSYLFNNTFANNEDWGLGVRENLGGVKVQHNNFVNNGRNVVVKDANTAFNQSYPSGGNYWSDYGGVDECSGPNQDVCPDPDGIGDTPHDIPHVVTGSPTDSDFYPLICPTWGCSRPLRPPWDFSAQLSGGRLQNVTLTWSPSPDDGAGLDSVVGYKVLRDTTYDYGGLGYQQIASLAKGASTFIDNLAGEGDSSNYYYQVCALDKYDNVSCAKDQVAKFTRALSPGPNLVSIPLIQSNESIEHTLQTVKFDKAWFYDSLSGGWKSHMPFKKYSRGLLNVNHTMGLWVNVTSDCNLTVAGIVPAQTAIHLYEGWNLVSFPSFNSSYTVYDLKMDTAAVRVEGHDSTPPYHLRVLGDAEALQAGEAYWVRVAADAEWIVVID